MGYYNIAPLDSHIHSLSARGVKTCLKEPKLKAMGHSRQFKIDKDYTVTAWWENTSYGFRHIAVLYHKGQEVERAKATYYNRTWESYEFRSVIYAVVSKHFPEKEVPKIMEKVDKNRGSMWAKGTNIPKVKEKMTEQEAEDRYKYELQKGLINTEDTPHYDSFEEFKQNLIDMGVEVLDAKGKKKLHKGWQKTVPKTKEKDVVGYSPDAGEYFYYHRMDAKGLYELVPRYDARQSFYGKAQVLVDDGTHTLVSYSTKVAEVKDGKPYVYGTYSSTTLRHIKEFLKQHGFKADSKDQIVKDYGKR
jgi:hypothetical protein